MSSSVERYHVTVDDVPLLFDTPYVNQYSRQLPSAESLRRPSRSSHVHRPSNSMRVMKPSSTSNSPQAMMARRRTLVNDGNMAKKHQQALDQVLLEHKHGKPASYEPFQEPAIKRANRPVSWHPSSYLQQQQQQQHYAAQMLSHHQVPQTTFSQYHLLASAPSYPDFYQGYQQYRAYSGHASPVSTDSPMALACIASSQPQAPPAYVVGDAWIEPCTHASRNAPNYSPVDTGSFLFYGGQSVTSYDASAADRLNRSTAPPTPENLEPAAQAQAVMASDDLVSCRPFEEAEEAGEILVGMGLYDTPDKAETDPELDNYRTSTSYLLGTTYRKGVGLKLEEAWEPPVRDQDEDEEDADGDQ